MSDKSSWFKPKDLTGQRFGKLMVEYSLGYKKYGSYVWHCKCDCGGVKDTSVKYLTSGDTSSCGCVSLERSKNLNYRHGKRFDPAYHVWLGMKERCFNKNAKFYENWGGRGITVEEPWKSHPEIFIEWLYKHGWKKNVRLSIERVDVNGNYCPENCKIATDKEQARNRTNNHIESYLGVAAPISELIERFDSLGLGEGCIRQRINSGWSIEESLETPKGVRRTKC